MHLDKIPHLIVLEVLTVALWVGIVTGGIGDAVFRHMVRTKFPTAWKEMGSPTFLNQSIASGWVTFRYTILRADYRRIPNQKLKMLGDSLRALWFVTMGIFIIDVVLFFVIRARIR